MKVSFKIIFAGLISAFAFICLYYKFNNAEQISLRSLSVIKHKAEYKIRTDTLITKKGKVKTNQSLSTLLLKHHIGYPTIDKLIKKSKEIFDVRKIRSGKNFTVLCKKDSTEKAHYFVYEIDAREYVVFDLRDDIKVYKGEKTVTKKVMAASGVINSSLYASLQKHNVNIC